MTHEQSPWKESFHINSESEILTFPRTAFTGFFMKPLNILASTHRIVTTSSLK
jgi:hypothetical protein